MGDLSSLSTILHLCISRLLDFKTQDTYFSKIKDRYRHIQSASFKNDALDDAFASLSLDGESSKPLEASQDRTTKMKPLVIKPDAANPNSKDLSIILIAMRKIREAIVASARKDAFASEVYVFIIRATISMGHLESYHPALLHLLHKIHPVMPLSESEHHEFLGYSMLDLACRQNDLASAYQLKCHYKYKDAKIEAVLKALVHGNWCRFWVLKGQSNIHQRRLMEFAEESMRTQAINCLGKSYLSVDKAYIEKATQQPWEEIKEREGKGWQLDGNVVTIRKINRR